MTVEIDLMSNAAGVNIARTLNYVQKQAIARVQDGVNEALAFVLQEAIPITPLRTGFLRGSFYIHGAYLQGREVRGRIGNKARYAGYVHRMPDNMNWTTPGTGPLYLARASRRNRAMVMDIIRSHLTARQRAMFKFSTSRLDRST